MTTLQLSEADWQQQCLDYARLMGWLCYHTFDSRRSEPGFPDIVAVRERIVFAEFKVGTALPTSAQERWLTRLRRAGAEAYVWYPRDWPLIEEALKRQPAKIRRAGDVDAGGRL